MHRPAPMITLERVANRRWTWVILAGVLLATTTLLGIAPEGLWTRVPRPARNLGLSVLYVLPYASAGVAVLGLVLIPWRRRLGLWLLLGGLAVGAASVLAYWPSSPARSVTDGRSNAGHETSSRACPPRP